jgi:hypothetical protein
MITLEKLKKSSPVKQFAPGPAGYSSTDAAAIRMGSVPLDMPRILFDRKKPTPSCGSLKPSPSAALELTSALHLLPMDSSCENDSVARCRFG